MQPINGSVGEAGANAASDVALVQAILLKTPRLIGPGRPVGTYLASYDGVCDAKTKTAIQAFQSDYVFVNAAGNQSIANPNATAGQVRPLDATWTSSWRKFRPRSPISACCPEVRRSTSAPRRQKFKAGSVPSIR